MERRRFTISSPVSIVTREKQQLFLASGDTVLGALVVRATTNPFADAFDDLGNQFDVHFEFEHHRAQYVYRGVLTGYDLLWQEGQPVSDPARDPGGDTISVLLDGRDRIGYVLPGGLRHEVHVKYVGAKLRVAHADGGVLVWCRYYDPHSQGDRTISYTLPIERAVFLRSPRECRNRNGDIEDIDPHGAPFVDVVAAPPGQ